jgi:V/A-type H+-transporting ATPase subunit F
MRAFLISDNVDTQVGMRLVGIEGVVVHERKELLAELDKVMQDEEHCIVLITTKLVGLCPEIIFELKLRQSKKLIVEIPDRHDTGKVGESIDAYVGQAIGIKL